MSRLFKQFVVYVVLTLFAVLVLCSAGCQGILKGISHDTALPADNAKSGDKDSASLQSPADNAALIDSLRSPNVQARLEALKAWTASNEKTLPIEAVDLRTDGDYRVRIAALEAIASRHHPEAMEFVSAALLDSDVRVRHAAIAALGVLGDTEALAALQKMMKDQNEAIRAQAVAALAAAKVERAVLDAADDKSWRVRRKVADALASFSDKAAAAAAQRLLEDNSAEVQLATVRALRAWPLEKSGPILLEAMTGSAYATRRLAAEQLTARWPAAKEFSVDGPADRRADVLKKLNQAFREQFGSAMANRSVPSDPAQQAVTKASPAQVAEVEQLLRNENLKVLADYGPALIDALEQLRFDRKQSLPDVIYHEVLPKYGQIFAVLDKLSTSDLAQRRRAAEELANLSEKHAPNRLAIARLTQLLSAEQDSLVWQSALRAISVDGSQGAMEMAYMGIGHASSEVRRRSCEHLAAYPDPAHAKVLIPALEDKDQAVVIMAAKALGEAEKMPDTKPLCQKLGSTNEEIQLAAALALTRLGDPSGKPALERLSYSNDPKVRAKTAQAMGEFPDAAFTPVLIRLLNDNLTVSRAALNSLPKVVGEDAAQSSDHSPTTTTEQMLRWKQWYQKRGQRTADRGQGIGLSAAR